MTPFGERLRELRRAKNVSQKQMAASLDEKEIAALKEVMDRSAGS